MKILHTSDLHLGKFLLEESFYEDQKYILKEIINIIKEKKIDVVLIAGDIYDKNIPSVDAVNLFNCFLNELSDLKTETIIISGNHDSNDRLSFGADLFNKLNIHIETNYDGHMKKYSYDNVDIYTLPFIKPFHLKNLMNQKDYEKINSANDMMKWILEQEKIDKARKNILVAHQFFMNAGEELQLSDSESTSIVGTLDAINVNLLDEFDYVALGHIHKPQKIKRETIRYSGTPLKYSFSEVNNNNGVVIYDTENDSIEIVPLEPLRKMRVIRGSFEDIIKSESSDDLIRVELTDNNTIISPMEEIKKKFPNALSLAFINYNKNEYLNIEVEKISEHETPITLFSKFYKMQNGGELEQEEIKYLEKIIENLGGEI